MSATNSACLSSAPTPEEKDSAIRDAMKIIAQPSCSTSNSQTEVAIGTTALFGLVGAEARMNTSASASFGCEQVALIAEKIHNESKTVSCNIQRSASSSSASANASQAISVDIGGSNYGEIKLQQKVAMKVQAVTEAMNNALNDMKTSAKAVAKIAVEQANKAKSSGTAQQTGQKSIIDIKTENLEQTIDTNVAENLTSALAELGSSQDAKVRIGVCPVDANIISHCTPRPTMKGQAPISEAIQLQSIKECSAENKEIIKKARENKEKVCTATDNYGKIYISQDAVIEAITRTVVTNAVTTALSKYIETDNVSDIKTSSYSEGEGGKSTLPPLFSGGFTQYAPYIIGAVVVLGLVSMFAGKSGGGGEASADGAYYESGSTADMAGSSVVEMA